MNTTAAALQAHVTTATIRAWARRGVIAATKAAGRWVINAASLAHRIAIAAMRTRKATVTEARIYTLDELKTLSVDEKKAIRRDAAARAETTRDRIRAALELPALTGSDRQIAWATELRAARIAQAIEQTTGTRFGEVALRLSMNAGVIHTDPLNLNALRILPWDTAHKFATETDLLAALHTALTADGRTSAAWWIDNR